MIYKMLRRDDSGDISHTEDLSTTYDSVEDPQLDLEMNAAGSFSVTLRGYTPKKTAFRDDTYMVYENGVEIFEGRPTEQERQYDGSVKIYCEGAYAYLQDGIVKPITGEITLDDSEVTPDEDGGVTLTPVQAVDYILRQYSMYMNSSFNRVIAYNKDMIDVQGTVYRKFDYEDCMSALSSLQDELGGQMWMSYASGRPALCWLRDNSDKWPESTQKARLGINMTDLSRKLTAGSVTAYMPLGNDIELIAEDDTTTQEDDTHVKKKSSLVGQPLTLTNRTDVNNGSDIIKTSDADSFGDVVQVLRLSAATASELLSKTQEYISRQALSQILTDVSVADLHYASGYEDDNAPIEFATKVGIRADYNGETINEDLFCSSMQIDLHSAEKTVSLGTIQRQSLSEKQTAAERSIEKAEENSGSATQDDIDNAINDAAASQADTDNAQNDRLKALEDAVKKLQSSSGKGDSSPGMKCGVLVTEGGTKTPSGSTMVNPVVPSQAVRITVRTTGGTLRTVQNLEDVTMTLPGTLPGVIRYSKDDDSYYFEPFDVWADVHVNASNMGHDTSLRFRVKAADARINLADNTVNSQFTFTPYVQAQVCTSSGSVSSRNDAQFVIVEEAVIYFTVTIKSSILNY